MSQGLHNQWNAFVSVLAQRNGQAEMYAHEVEQDGKRMAYRTRVFEVLGDGRIIAELPTQAFLDRAYRVGDLVDLLLMETNERLAGVCKITEAINYQINANATTHAVLLSAPTKLFRDQRRSFFRVSVAGEDFEPVKLVDNTTSPHLTVDAKLMNLSASGLGVTVKATEGVLKQVRSATDVIVTAQLGDESIQTPAWVVYELARDEDMVDIGLQFKLDNEFQAEAMQERMNQLCLHYQREQIKRQRRA